MARRDFLSGISLVMELALICIHFLYLTMQNHRFDDLHVLHPPEFSPGLWHNKRLDPRAGSSQPVLPSRSTRLPVHRNHLFARNSCTFIQLPSILVSKSARRSKSKYVDKAGHSCYPRQHTHLPRLPRRTARGLPRSLRTL